jgi:hypothetical protein
MYSNINEYACVAQIDHATQQVGQTIEIPSYPFVSFLRRVSQDCSDKLPAFLQGDIGELLEAFRSGEIAVLEQASTLAAIVLLRFSAKVLPEVG